MIIPFYQTVKELHKNNQNKIGNVGCKPKQEDKEQEKKKKCDFKEKTQHGNKI